MALTVAALNMTTGAINTKGAYGDYFASTPYDSSRIHLQVCSCSAGRRAFLIDIATGAAGAETVVIANMAIISDSDFLIGGMVAIDVDIPAGTRLSGRAQSLTATQNITCNIYLENRPLRGIANPVQYGTFTNSRGTVIDPGATIATKGAYTQITASTTVRIDELIFWITSSIDGNTFSAYTDWRIDVATGAAGVETIVIADILVQANLNADALRPPVIRLPIPIPIGTRIAIRGQCNRNTPNAERQFAVTLLGIQTSELGGGATSVAYIG